METRNLKAIVVSCYTDDLINVTYLKILTEVAVESIKLPTALSNYRLQHLLRPNFILDIEVVKTRKNWILKGILHYQPFCHPKTYQCYLKLAEVFLLVNKFCYEGQQVDLLSFLVNKLSLIDLETLDINLFELSLLQKLGFAPKEDYSNNINTKLHFTKTAGGLI